MTAPGINWQGNGDYPEGVPIVTWEKAMGAGAEDAEPYFNWWSMGVTADSYTTTECLDWAYLNLPEPPDSEAVAALKALHDDMVQDHEQAEVEGNTAMAASFWTQALAMKRAIALLQERGL